MIFLLQKPEQFFLIIEQESHPLILSEAAGKTDQETMGIRNRPQTLIKDFTPESFPVPLTQPRGFFRLSH